jgi:hypothetical protein
MLWGHLRLGFLPGQRCILDHRPGEENHPGGQGGEPGSAVSGFFALKTGAGPAEGCFVEMQPGFNGPTAIVFAPDGFDGEDHPCWDRFGG